MRSVAPVDGHVPAADMAAAVDGRTRVVSVPHVTFSPGFRSDVRTVADAAHAHGALVLVDAAQSVGAIAVDVRDLGADALAVATQKCLLALYGFGFLYVRRAVAEAMTPSHVARYGMDLGTDAGETARGEGDLPFARGARRFDLGNYNYLGARAAEAALTLIGDIGVARIEAHVRGLAAWLASGLLDLGLPVVGGPPGPHLVHIVAVGESGGGQHDTADDPAMNDLYAHLRAHRVRPSVRNGVLRMSVGVYNDEADIDRVLSLVRAWKERRARPGRARGLGGLWDQSAVASVIAPSRRAGTGVVGPRVTSLQTSRQAGSIVEIPGVGPGPTLRGGHPDDSAMHRFVRARLCLLLAAPTGLGLARAGPRVCRGAGTMAPPSCRVNARSATKASRMGRGLRRRRRRRQHWRRGRRAADPRRGLLSRSGRGQLGLRADVHGADRHRVGPPPASHSSARARSRALAGIRTSAATTISKRRDLGLAKERGAGGAST